MNNCNLCGHYAPQSIELGMVQLWLCHYHYSKFSMRENFTIKRDLLNVFRNVRNRESQTVNATDEKPLFITEILSTEQCLACFALYRLGLDFSDFDKIASRLWADVGREREDWNIWHAIADILSWQNEDSADTRHLLAAILTEEETLLTHFGDQGLQGNWMAQLFDKDIEMALPLGNDWQQAHQFSLERFYKNGLFRVEHLLLGFITESRSSARIALVETGVDLERLISLVSETLERSNSAKKGKVTSESIEAKRHWEYIGGAIKIARQHRCARLFTAHYLLGVLRFGNDLLTAVLRSFLDYDVLDLHIRALLEGNKSR